MSANRGQLQGASSQEFYTAPSTGGQDRLYKTSTPQSDHASSEAGRPSAASSFPPRSLDSSVPPVPAEDYWPRNDSSSDDEDNASKSTQESNKKKGGSATSSMWKFFRTVAKKLGKAYKPRYGYLPQDEEERARNEVQHRAIWEMFEERLFLSPCPNPKKVLDVGAAPGVWALQYAKENPQTQVLGIDLEKIRPPPGTPKNVKFLVMDADQKWEIDGGFDLIHVRHIGDLQNHGDLVSHIYEHLKPGGWAEFTEWIVNLQSPDHSFDGTALQKWNYHISQGMEALGTTVFYPTRYKDLLRKNGFCNVSERKYAAPTNACYPGRRLQRIGDLMSKNWLMVLEPISIPVFNALKWSQEELDALLAECRKEIPDTKYHSYATLMTVFCQKPFEDGSSNSSILTSPSITRVVVP